MAQNLTIKIAGKTYKMSAPSPEVEELMRLAAGAIEKRIVGLTQKYPSKPMVDLLAFAALNESMDKLVALKSREALKKEIEAVQREADAYIESIVEK